MEETSNGKKGGYLKGKKHSEGGIKAVVDGTKTVELEGGETVINSKSMSDNEVVSVVGTKKQIASAINSDKGYGVSFASGAKIKRGAAFKKGGIVSGSKCDMETCLGNYLPFLVWW